MKKKWYLSKTLWVAVVVFIGSLLAEFGIISEPFDAGQQGMILGVIFFILRLVTKEPVGGNSSG